MRNEAGHGWRAALGFALLLGSSPAGATPPPFDALFGHGTSVIPPVTATCALGPTGPGSTYTWNVPFAYFHVYELVRPTRCANCAGAVQLETVKWRLRFPTTCSFVVRLSIVAAGGPAACPYPDTTRMRCSPALHTITTAGPMDQVDLAMPVGCCIDEPAFLRAEIVSHACAWGETAFWLADHCQPCEEYRAVESDGFSKLWDFCQDGSGFSMRLWADASCCQPTSVGRVNWGTLKAIYR